MREKWLSLRAQKIHCFSVLIFLLLSGCEVAHQPHQVPSGSRSKQDTEAASSLDSSPKAGVSEEAAVLPFTLEVFLQTAGPFVQMESLGEFQKTQKFACKSEDGSAGITGEYVKSGGRLRHITVTGSGDTWRTIVESCIALSNLDLSNSKEVAMQLGIVEDEQKTASVDVGDLQYSVMPVFGKTVFLLRNKREAEAADKGITSNEYVQPTVGRSLGDFKNSFNATIQELNPALRIKGPGEETTSVTYFCYQFSEDTILHVYTNKEMIIQNVELDSVEKDAFKFWNCAEATIAAIDPKLNQDERKQLLQQVGYQNENNLPRTASEFDSGELHYLYAFVGIPPGCALSIQSNKP